MSAIIQRGVRVEETGKSTRISKDNIAKLMYYLHCVNRCLDFLKPEVTDFKKYTGASEEVKSAVMIFAALVNPDLLLGKVFILVHQNEPALRGSGNNFVTIHEASRVVAADKVGDHVVVIDGRRVTANTLMLVTEGWIKAFFLDPFTEEAWRLKKLSEAEKMATKRRVES